VVDRVKSVKYLGVLLDERLDFYEYVLALTKKAASRLSFLHRYSSLLDFRTRKLLSSCLVNSNLEYCCSAWYPGLTVNLRNRLDVIQRKVVRFVLNLGPRDHVGVAEIGSINWLSFPKRVSFFKLMHVFKISKGLAPSYLLDRFTRTSAVHSYSTRGSDVNYYWSDVNRSTNTFTR
jgi:hypothetical protein